MIQHAMPRCLTAALVALSASLLAFAPALRNLD